MRKLLLIVLLLESVGITSYCGEGNESLRSLVSASDLIVAGTVGRGRGGLTISTPVVHYPFPFKVKEVLKGDPTLKGQEILTEVVRCEIDNNDRLPYFDTGKDCVLFLKHSGGGYVINTGGNVKTQQWTSVDNWFSVQPPSRELEFTVKRLVGNGE
jgi:hypothetical protein